MYSQTKKSNAFVGFFIALLMIIPAVLGVIFSEDIKGWFGTPEDVPTEEVQPDELPDGDDLMTDIENSDMLKLSKRNKVSANGQVLSVSATLSPDWIIDKTVTWSASWKTTNSANVMDYITLKTSSDTLSCDVSVKKAFTTQIILTCYATSNSNVKATCTIDYVGKTINVSKIDGSEWADLIGEAYSTYKVSDVVNYKCNISDISNYSLSGGTLQGTLKNLKVNSIKVEGVEVSSNQAQTIESILVSKYGSMGAAYDELEGTFDVEFSVTLDIYYNDTLIKSGATYSNSGYFLFDLSGYRATGLTLSDTQLIF